MDDVEALSQIVTILKQLEPDTQKRVLEFVHAFLGSFASSPPRAIDYSRPILSDKASFGNTSTNFSRDRSLAPKEFMSEKRPITDVDRVVCVAYYLTHYRDTPQFKTLDVSALNTEAAQPKFSNSSVAVENATRDGLLVPAVKGTKQITAAGERYVDLLPDRERAREALRQFRPRRSGNRRVRKAP